MLERLSVWVVGVVAIAVAVLAMRGLSRPPQAAVIAGLVVVLALPVVVVVGSWLLADRPRSRRWSPIRSRRDR